MGQTFLSGRDSVVSQQIVQLQIVQLMKLSIRLTTHGMNPLPDDPSAAENVVPSAFPALPDCADTLPIIPGGWTSYDLPIADHVLKLIRPTNPDLFLDDVQVHEKNSQNDYMPYWAFLWPSAMKMAAAVLRAEWPMGTRVLELGAGIGLVGVASLLRGDRVTFSDYDSTALHMCRLNARLNGLPDPELLELDWRNVPRLQFPVLVGCEVTYDAALHLPLLKLIEQMLEPGGICWLGDPGRYQAQNFYQAAVDYGFCVQVLDESGNIFNSPLSGAFQILRLVR